MPYSSLIYRDLKPDGASSEATIIALHGNHGSLEDLVPLARTLGARLRIVAPEAARAHFEFRSLVAHSWYGGWQSDHPDPVSFGDSLAQVERFIHDVRDRSDAPDEPAPWLLGYDQGAVLALTIASVAPDLISGVMALCGSLPTFSDRSLLQPVIGSLPVLLIGDPAARSPDAAAIDATAATLTRLGHHLTIRWLSGASELGPQVRAELRAWLTRQSGQPRPERAP